MRKRNLGTLKEPIPAVQLASVIPRQLHTDLKCEAIKRDMPLRALIAAYLRAGLKGARA
jgi:hypothetical protein